MVTRKVLWCWTNGQWLYETKLSIAKHYDLFSKSQLFSSKFLTIFLRLLSTWPTHILPVNSEYLDNVFRCLFLANGKV